MPEAGKGMGKEGFGDDDFDGLAGNFGAARWVERVVQRERFQSLQADENRPSAGQANANPATRKLVGVFPAVHKKVVGFLNIALEERGNFLASFIGGWDGEILWRQTALEQGVLGQVTSPLPQVVGKVSEDVEQLKPFSKANAGAKNLRRRAWVGAEFLKANSSPKLANATGHAVSVVVQLSV